MTAVWDLSDHKGSALLLLLALADYADDVGLCWPGQGTLAKKTRLSRRQVIRISAKIQETGELWVLQRRHTSNISIVVPGLTIAQLEMAADRAVNRGVVPPPTTGSDILSLPPQVIGVVTKCHGGGDKMSRGGDKKSQVGDTGDRGVVTPMSHDPSLSVIDPSMIQGDYQSWPDVLACLEGRMAKQTFDAHLLGSVAEFKDGVLIVRPRHPRSAEILEWRLKKTIQDTARAAINLPDLEISFMEETTA